MLGCNFTPAEFWTEYNQDLIEDKFSDQGPWGGTRTIYWESEKNLTFRPVDILEFAKSNDWTLNKSENMSKEELDQILTYNKNRIQIELSEIIAEHNRFVIDFPIYFTDDITLYRFSTGWLLFEPGTDNSTTENGFILLNKNKNKMVLYHRWGE